MTTGIYAQEVLLSPNEKYFDFLSLGGYIERPSLNYRTLSDSQWEAAGDNANDAVWADVYTSPRRVINDHIRYRIYGPEIFTSYNSTNPYGQNDGVLWQGKGVNMFLSAGARLELYGFELTLFPEFALSQNQSFETFPSVYSNEFGYYWSLGSDMGVDAPQRFGDKPYYEFSWGNTEIRYSWKTFTAGFGTQNIWLGPAKINPILLSNNAPPFPKLDLGIRRQPITIRNIYFGDIEVRIFGGMLSESDFFDNDDSNDRNLITGLALAYSFPALLKGLTVGFNRLVLSKWNNAGYDDILTLFTPFIDQAFGNDERDQRGSFFLNYVFPSVGFEFYFEWARNDFSPNIYSLIKYPFHTQAYTFGTRKSFIFNPAFQGELLFELTNLESSRDYDFGSATTFYAHHLITQGHTNRGQWLGAGIGTGGNSQYLGFTLFYKMGYANLFIQRQNVDSDYHWFNFNSSEFMAIMSIGAGNYINLYKYLGLYTGIVYSENFEVYSQRNRNINISLGLRYLY
jgi:hypothetical protein